MKARWLAFAASLAACSSTPTPQTAGYRGPSALAWFVGVTEARPGQIWPYLAVANARGDDLSLLDPSGDTVLNSPGHAFPLSVPVLQSPRYLASASLRDGGTDLLAAAGVGSVVQIVGTWEEGTRVAKSYELAGLAGTGAEIVSMTAAPYPGPPAGTPPVATVVPGRTLLLVGFSGANDGRGGKLVVVEFRRGPDGASVEAVSAAANPLGFDPVSLSVSPDGFHLYAATPDPVTDFTTFPPAAGARTVSGVGEVDMSAGPPGSWPVRGLDAMAPTTLVMSALLGERVDREYYVKGTPPNDQFGPPVLRVYAALDASGCGRDHVIECGVVTLDPATGTIPPDPAPPAAIGTVPRQPYRAPVVLPAFPLTMAAAMPAVTGETQCVDIVYGDQIPCPENQPDQKAPEPTKQPIMRLAPETGQRWTTATGVVGAADGNAYFLDLGRYQAVNDTFLLTDDTTRVRITSAVSLAQTSATARLGLFVQYASPGIPAGLTTDSTKMLSAVMVTPGFTRAELWALTWQGVLPGLGQNDLGLGADEPCAVGLEPDGSLFLALQAPIGTTWTSWIPGPDVSDPHLGVHPADAWPVGDLVEFAVVDPNTKDPQTGLPVDPCPIDPNKHEGTIASLLPPIPSPSLHPGWALKIPVPPAPAPDPFQLRCLANALATSTTTPVLIGAARVRGSGLVLAGSVTGYAGRPPLLQKQDVDAGHPEAKRYNLAWADESTLSGEALVLARKARRFHYPYDRPCRPKTDGSPNTCYSPYPELSDPLAPGPAVGLIAGPLCNDLGAICPPTRVSELLRGSTVQFSTDSGVFPWSHRPVPGSLPTGAVAVDKSQFPEGVVLGASFYLSYQLDAVLMSPLGQAANQTKTLR